jgi:hypothetical protein
LESTGQQKLSTSFRYIFLGNLHLPSAVLARKVWHIDIDES